MPRQMLLEQKINKTKSQLSLMSIIGDLTLQPLKPRPCSLQQVSWIAGYKIILTEFQTRFLLTREFLKNICTGILFMDSAFSWIH